jgi:dUTP pyrophosphatase
MCIYGTIRSSKVSPMMQLSFGPVPKLVIGNDTYYGINIIEKLHEITKDDPEDNALFMQAINIHQRTHLPRLGFYLEASSAVLPTKRISDVGYDLTAVDIYKEVSPITKLYETYVSLEIPLGYYVELVPRSSLSKTGYMLANSVGIIDPSFTGTLKIPLIKIDHSMPDLELPARVAQLILKPYIISEGYVAEHAKIKTERGSGGFGSTG